MEQKIQRSICSPHHGSKKGKGTGLSHRETHLETRKTEGTDKGEAERPDRRGAEKETDSHS